MAIGPHPKNEDITQDHLMFGVVTINGKSRPVLQKQATEEDACTECRGYGHGGNPLCGAIYTCDACDGTGLRQPGQPPYAPKSEDEPLKECQAGGLGWRPLAVLVVLVILGLAVHAYLIQR